MEIEQAFLHISFLLKNKISSNLTCERHNRVQKDHTVRLYFICASGRPTQTNQTKQKFIRLYSLDCWIQIVQFDEKTKV